MSFLLVLPNLILILILTLILILILTLMILRSGRLIGTEIDSGFVAETATGIVNGTASAEKSVRRGCPGGKTSQRSDDPPDQTTVSVQKEQRKNDGECPVVVAAVAAEESDGVAVGVGNGSCKEGVTKVSECARDEERALHPTKTQKTRPHCCRPCASRALDVGSSRKKKILRRKRKDSSTKDDRDRDHDH